MPLIIVTGYPCSGKTARCEQIKEYVESNNSLRTVHFVSEENTLSELNTDKNKLPFDSKKQKEVCGILKSTVTRLLGPDVVILDANNNIKGFRYELYCATKCHKTTQCVIKCDISKEEAWKLNELRGNDKYTQKTFEILIALYEPPESSNRWDSPLFTIHMNDKLPGQEICDMLFNRQVPRPNQSTQSVPSCSSLYLSNLDKVTKDVINVILFLQNSGIHGEKVKLADFDVELAVLDERIDLKKLTCLKRQFISYYKVSATINSEKNIAKMFVQFINSNVGEIHTV